ncbi:uncharacterized protein ARMOST_15956 [Armillaria ostoyae]|uniref:Uncharacterized protein n=1 Tax=Armillaria ostoyae TaxID=47428 RepID=A0A284RUT1_ARMOS|nr:uncharacterized protein ARMOST_15956 [Armillaria ostoyae]
MTINGAGALARHILTPPSTRAKTYSSEPWRRWLSVQRSDELSLPGTTLRFQFQAQGSSAFEPLAATITSARVSQHDSLDTMPWTPSMDDHLRRAIRDIQAVIPDWFEVISDSDNRPETELWEGWMWEVSTWFGNNTELAAHRLLHRLQGRYIPRPFGVVRLYVTPEPTLLHCMSGLGRRSRTRSRIYLWR